MIGEIVFNLFAFTFFILMFLKLLMKNDASYVYLLVLQFVGIVIDFIELTTHVTLSSFVKCVMYILSIILPIVIFLIERIKKVSFSEIFNTLIANLYIMIGNDEKAEKYLNEVIRKYNNCKAHKKLAELYEKAGKKEKALEEYEKSFELGGDGVIVGKLYAELGRNKEAKEVFYDILKQKPNCYKASIMLGDVLFNEGEYKDAIQVYLVALKFRPADYDLYYNLGMTYTMLNDFIKAKENYEKAANINSDVYNARYSLGQLNLIYGELDVAEKYFEECINSEDTESKAYFYLARIAIIKGERDKAINYANIAVEDDAALYNIFQKDNIFVTIKDKIRKPDLQQEKEKTTNITKKEERIMKHLDHTCKLVGKLNNNDIQMIENAMKEKKNTEKQIEEI